MLLRDLIQEQGNTLFRYRGYVPLLLLPALFFALQDSEWIERRYGDFVDDVFDWFCVGVCALGLALRVATVGFVPRGTSGRNATRGQVAEELNTTGMYSIVRNPLYLSNTIILVAFLLATGSAWLVCLGLLACCLHYERIICAEEAFLSQRFGARYLAWAESTPAFFPTGFDWKSPAHPFSWRTAIRREYLTAFGIIVSFAVLDYAEDWIALGNFELEFETTVLLLAGSLGFLFIRFLRKRTRVLHVAGR